MSWWPAVVFGWPAILLAILLAITGVSRQRPAALFISAVIALQSRAHRQAHQRECARP